MTFWPLLFELVIVCGGVLGWAAWDLRKTSKLLEASRKAEAAREDRAKPKESDGAS